MHFRRSLYSIVFAVSLMSISGSVVYAGNPHFRAVSAQLGSPRLSVSGIEVGLGSGATVSYEASASVTTTAKCLNGGGKNPSASNKAFSGELASNATEKADNSGKITTELVLLALPTSFCPPGQGTVVATATFTNVTLTDTTNGVIASIPGTFEYVAP